MPDGAYDRYDYNTIKELFYTKVESDSSERRVVLVFAMHGAIPAGCGGNCLFERALDFFQGLRQVVRDIVFRRVEVLRDLFVREVLLSAHFEYFPAHRRHVLDGQLYE